jgi:hypothetical protein
MAIDITTVTLMDVNRRIFQASFSLPAFDLMIVTP